MGRNLPSLPYRFCSPWPGSVGQLLYVASLSFSFTLLYKWYQSVLLPVRRNRKLKWNLEIKCIYNRYKECTKRRAKRVRPALVYLLYVYMLVLTTQPTKSISNNFLTAFCFKYTHIHTVKFLLCAFDRIYCIILSSLTCVCKSVIILNSANGEYETGYFLKLIIS